MSEHGDGPEDKSAENLEQSDHSDDINIKLEKIVKQLGDITGSISTLTNAQSRLALQQQRLERRLPLDPNLGLFSQSGYSQGFSDSNVNQNHFSQGLSNGQQQTGGHLGSNPRPPFVSINSPQQTIRNRNPSNPLDINKSSVASATSSDINHVLAAKESLFFPEEGLGDKYCEAFTRYCNIRDSVSGVLLPNKFSLGEANFPDVLDPLYTGSNN